MEEFCVNKQLQENGCVSTVRYQVPNCVCILNKISLFFLSFIHKFSRKDGRDFVFRFYEIKFKKRPYAKFI